MRKHTNPRLKINLFLSLTLLLFGAAESMAQQTLENINQALRYSRYSRVSPKIIPLKEGDRRFRLQMPIEKIEEGIENGIYQFAYAVVGSYQEPLTADKWMELRDVDIIRETGYHFYFEKQVDIPQDQEMAFAVLRVTDTRQGDEYYYHTDLISPFIFEYPEFWGYYSDGIPFDQNFLTMKEPLEFKSRGTISIQHFHYPTLFDIPLPPMEIRPASVPRELTVNYEGEFLTNIPKSFDELGYYFLQTDTTSAAGMLIRSVHDAFPKVKDYEEMVDMVAYISTRREHEALKEAEDKKQALDLYWFNLTKEEEASRKIIREYFKQIEFASILFTDFKEGWKTDRGMVYTVMGPPNEVLFRLNGEIWSYLPENSNSKITFTFARVKNILTPNYYVLNRSRALQPEWFKSITQWRNAQMAF
ncbi:GWxTD domain-containing protein [Mongoliitalea daihaiensis]|uniref:GWxTD domain-containing protein n=1 Tax=Mongoliitalea daihaiensis TaxID=2782006 RepID=UPI001F3BB30D|nr:GWxTD domain-containing protein [Mongoliitalea daihaiensis]UJP66685.1 GWxTD domain-containing protein [Mongoliitalea daihaiensis]